ncbi:MAG: hypothetical protein A2Z31_01660 [candidate division NC10 bacterium RBG_16_65_8]|nr:MAG: hypothetical protein A2Z31_01660 [candidate division NC10 bacterium RBG_16_65_8]
MALHLRNFTPAHRRAVRRSRNAIERRLANLPCPVPRDLVESLRAILFADRPLVDLVYGGGDGGPATPYARSAGYRIVLYARAFSATAGSQARLAPVLFHELIHIARGWELDSEAFENAWFTRKEGARPPTREDWAIFKDQRYQGWWVRVDPRTRRVTDYADRPIHTFPARPTRSG